MTLTKEQVLKIAQLCCIRLTEEEVEHFTQELTQILGLAEQLAEVDTSQVKQMTSVSELTLPWREDKVTDGDIQEQVLANAPQADYGCYVVPKVVE